MGAAVIRFLELWWFWIDWGTFAAATLSIPSVLLRRRGRPVAAVSWILALVSLPVVGIVLWWLFGRRHLERRRRRKRWTLDKMSRKLETVRDQLQSPPSHLPTLLPVKYVPIELEHSVFPPTSGNVVELLDSKDAFDIMERDIRAAKHHVHALFYIWKNDATGKRFRDTLIDAAQRGCEVRVLCDAIGSPVMATAFSRPLRKAGARVERFLPPTLLTATPRLNFRNHRKILVVDGTTGFIGGFNIGDEYRNDWRDLGVRIGGPAVDQLQEIFADDWYYASDEDLADTGYFGRWTRTKDGHGTACAAVASGPDTLTAPIHDALFMAMNEAKERLFLMTPYFIPTRSIMAAMRAAVYRGVDVRLMVPARSDVSLVRHASRSYYPELLEVGARIYEYQPTMLHAKVALFDDELVMVGSANVDNRSFKLNFEAICFIGGRKLNREVSEVFFKDLEQCEEISARDIEQLPWVSKLASATAHLLSPLL